MYSILINVVAYVLRASSPISLSVSKAPNILETVNHVARNAVQSSKETDIFRVFQF